MKNSVGTNEKSDFYELWQWQKLLKVRWVRFDVIIMMIDIYINFNLKPLTEFTSSSWSTESKDILSWNISQMITKTILISTRIVISYANEMGHPVLSLLETQWKWDNNMIRISQWRERINTSVGRKKEIQKSRTVRVTVKDLSRKVNHLS